MADKPHASAGTKLPLDRSPDLGLGTALGAGLGVSVGDSAGRQGGRLVGATGLAA
jgi:hypothetical protein